MTFIGLVGGCIFILGFAQSHWIIPSMLLLLLLLLPLLLLLLLLLGGLGFCQYIFRVGNSTLLQTIVPDALRGRVMSIYFLDNGFTPLVTLAISLFVHLWSPSGAFRVIAGIGLLLAILQLISFRPVRQLE